MTLMDTYMDLVGLDQDDEVVAEQEEIKEAEAHEGVVDVVKLAYDYDAAGRRLAHVFFGNYVKTAAFGREEEESARMEEREGEARSEEKEDEAKAREKRRKKEGEGEEQAAVEKKAEIMDRLRSDPEYREAAVDWYTGQ
jgi:hypothetical protein